MSENAVESPMRSPCVNVCTLDAQAGYCLGCGRTLAEIAGWVRMSGDERDRVMAQLPARLAARAPVRKAANG